jgi:TolB-like protein/Flp pilus assembly protein TadD
MADIFISYSSQDSDKALELSRELTSRGISVWIDQQGIEGAAQWSSEIARAVAECKALLLLVSKSSMASKNCAKEVTIAAEADKHILPVDLENIPLPVEFKYHLAGLHRVAYSNKDGVWRAIENLLSAKKAEVNIVSHDTHESLIRIAVLPFDDLSQKKDSAWFADGMMDELIGTLSQVQKLRVASRSEVIYYKKHRPKAKKIADDLNVRYLIEGSVRKAGKKIRITASLTDMAYGEQLWMNNYDGTFKDVFDFQETVSKQIAEALRLKLSPQEEKAIEEKPTQNAEAYELYLKGKECAFQATRAGYEQALIFFEKAILIDPDYAVVHLEIANTCSAYYREFSRNPQWLKRANEQLLIAEKITGETAQTLWIRGEIAWQSGDFVIAETALKKAAVLDPKFPRTFNILGNMYYGTGRAPEAVEAFNITLQLIENTTTYYNLLAALSISRDPERLQATALKSLSVFEKHLVQHPKDFHTRVCYGFALFWANQISQAEKEVEQLTESDQLDGVQSFNLGTLSGKLGQDQRQIELTGLAISRGFRQIEAVKEMITESPNLKNQLNKILIDLESIIEKERMLT